VLLRRNALGVGAESFPRAKPAGDVLYILVIAIGHRSDERHQKASAACVSFGCHGFPQTEKAACPAARAGWVSLCFKSRKNIK
jgi:hypothetical protein